MQLKIDGKLVDLGKAFRLGYRRQMTGTDLIVWIEIQRDRMCEVELTGS